MAALHNSVFNVSECVCTRVRGIFLCMSTRRRYQDVMHSSITLFYCFETGLLFNCELSILICLDGQRTLRIHLSAPPIHTQHSERLATVTLHRTIKVIVYNKIASMANLALCRHY